MHTNSFGRALGHPCPFHCFQLSALPASRVPVRPCAVSLITVAVSLSPKSAGLDRGLMSLQHLILFSFLQYDSDAEVRTAGAEARVSSLEIELRRKSLEAQATMEELQAKLHQKQVGSLGYTHQRSQSCASTGDWSSFATKRHINVLVFFNPPKQAQEKASIPYKCVCVCVCIDASKVYSVSRSQSCMISRVEIPSCLSSLYVKSPKSCSNRVRKDCLTSTPLQRMPLPASNSSLPQSVLNWKLM